MRFVPVKSKERQAACMLMTVRERLVSVKSRSPMLSGAMQLSLALSAPPAGKTSRH
jgi:hypothetical protein